jgi:protein-disulfide isomerase/peroxiredoxin
MSNRIRKTLVQSTIVLLCVLFTSVMPSLALTERAVLGEVIPSFNVTFLDGQTISSNIMRNTGTVLHFWASWQPDAIDNLKVLDTSVGGGNFRVLGINSTDSVTTIETFLKQTNLRFPHTANSEVAYLFNITEVPATVVIDREGVFTRLILGQLDTQILRDINDSLAQAQTSEVNYEIEAPIPLGTNIRYDDIPQSTTPEGFPLLGNPNASVMVYGFSAFICSHCVNFHGTIFSSLLERVQVDDDIAFVYVPMHNAGELQNGYEANTAALCAGKQGKFWEMHDMLYLWHIYFEQEAYTTERLRWGVEHLKLDIDEWQVCVDSGEMDDTLEDALNLFYASGFSGVTTVTVNGERVDTDLNAINEAIDDILGTRT